MKLLAAAVMAGFVAAPALGGQSAWINEFHYDNAGTDSGEFIEVVLDIGISPADVDVHLYNGSDQLYYTDSGTAGSDLFNVGTHFAFAGLFGGKNYYTLSLPSNGIQNGDPDAIGLTLSGAVVEFLSYDGAFSGAGGPFSGVGSSDIGVGQTSSTPVGSSLQRLNFGSSWIATDGSNTFGAVNIPAPAALALLGLAGAVSNRRRRA